MSSNRIGLPVFCALLGVVATAFVDSGCGGRTFGEHGYEELDGGGCPAKATVLTGHAGAGADCNDAADCAPICCTCNTGNIQYLSAWCDLSLGTPGRCSQACSSGLATQKHYCP